MTLWNTDAADPAESSARVDGARPAAGNVPDSHPRQSDAIEAVRRSTADLRQTLIAPEHSALTTGIEALAAAVSRLSQLEQDWRAAPPADPVQRAKAREDLEALRLELRRLEPVVRHGEEFWRGWARMLGLDTGYTAVGAPGAVETTSAVPRITVEG